MYVKTAILSLLLTLIPLYLLAVSSGVVDAALTSCRPVRSEAAFNALLAEMTANLREREDIALRGELLEADVPELLHRAGIFDDEAVRYVITPRPGRALELRLEYKDSARLLAAHENPALRPRLTKEELRALETAEQDVAALTSAPGMSARDKLRALHDHLVQQATFDFDAGGSCCSMLLRRRGVCEAYSRALWLECRMVGLPCHIVTGVARGPHSWNLVCLDGAWQHVDASWDDPLVPFGREPIVSHRYFCLNDTQMAETHHWDRTLRSAGTTVTADTPEEEGATALSLPEETLKTAAAWLDIKLWQQRMERINAPAALRKLRDDSKARWERWWLQWLE